MPNFEKTEKQYIKKPLTQSAYKAPRLLEFGPIGALTQAGTSMGMEATVMGLPNDMRP